MDGEKSLRSILATIVSWLALLLALASLWFVATYVPADRAKWEQAFNDLEWDLSPAMVASASISDHVIYALAASLALACVVAQWFLRDKLVAVLFHFSIVLHCCLAFMAHRESIHQFFSAFMHSVTR